MREEKFRRLAKAAARLPRSQKQELLSVLRQEAGCGADDQSSSYVLFGNGILSGIRRIYWRDTEHFPVNIIVPNFFHF